MASAKVTDSTIERLAESFERLRRLSKERPEERTKFTRHATKSFCVKMPTEMAVRLLGWARDDGVTPQEIIRRLLAEAFREKDA